MPGDEVLIALGKMVLHFAELEYWVNSGIIEAEHITDTAEEARVTRDPFNKKVKRLEKALAAAKAKGWIQFGKDFGTSVDFLPQLMEVAVDRNDLLHGATFTRVSKSAPFEVHHRKVNPKTNRETGGVDVRVHNLDKATLDKLSDRIRDYAERLEFAVLDLCHAKQAKGVGSLTWG